MEVDIEKKNSAKEGSAKGTLEKNLEEMQQEMAAMEQAMLQAQEHMTQMQQCMDSFKQRMMHMINEEVRTDGEATTSPYPAIGEKQEKFFAKNLALSGKGNGGIFCRSIPMPTEWMMQRIFDFTKEWNPEKKSSVHKWKILYEVMRGMRIFRIQGRQRYKDFVGAVVAYCFPKVSPTFSNNISKCTLGGDYKYWTAADNKLYHQLWSLLEVKK